MTEGKSESALGLLCPTCRVSLTMSERQGIEIDYCPQCRGVWLDRGELDKIIERSEVASPDVRPQPTAPPSGNWGDDRFSHEGKSRPKNYRKSFLSELFD